MHSKGLELVYIRARDSIFHSPPIPHALSTPLFFGFFILFLIYDRNPTLNTHQLSAQATVYALEYIDVVSDPPLVQTETDSIWVSPTNPNVFNVNVAC